ncbi:MAG: hypothetical protein PVS3B3_06870 [Ktedonobacteraceae bacterium]
MGLEKIMQYVLWVITSLIAYIAGVYILLRVTPMLLHRQYDEGFFMGIAALDILAALLAFGGIIIPLLLFSGSIGIRIFAVLLLLGILFVAIRLANRSLRPRITSGTFRTSRIIAGSYSIFLILASLYYLVQIFILGR